MNRKRFRILGLIMMIICTMVSICENTVPMEVISADSIDVQETYDNKVESSEGTDNFFEEHKDEFVDYQNEFSNDTEEKVIHVFTYPFSDELIDKTVDSYANLPFQYLYYADYELMWAYVESEEIKGWICINEPGVRFFNREETEISDNSDGTSPLHKEQAMSEKQVLILVVGLVAGLIVVTGVLLAIFWKKEKK